MNLLKTFEGRIADAFGAAPQGFAAPFSFKKLAKRATREMENETFEVDGVDTAPALYTILVSAADDSVMRPLYGQLTKEIVSFVEAQAQAKGYVFTGKPLTRFMVDPALKGGRFAVFAENVDALTLGRLREEEEAFLTGSAGLGGAASQLRAGAGRTPSPRQADPVPVTTLRPVEEPARPFGPDAQEFAPLVGPAPLDASAGLSVLPESVVDDALQAAPLVESMDPLVPLAPPEPAAAAHGSSPETPLTQRRNVPLVNHQNHAVGRGQSADEPSCLLIDHQTGKTYTAHAPATVMGRERMAGSIVLRDPNVSRRHAKISYDGRVWHISDLGSTNGTLVNNVDVDSVALRSGDMITVGLTNLEFRESKS